MGLEGLLFNMLPGIGQGLAGGIQAGGDFLTTLLNMDRATRAGEFIIGEGADAAAAFRGEPTDPNATPEDIARIQAQSPLTALRGGREEVARAGRGAEASLNDALTRIQTGRGETLGAFEGIVPKAEEGFNAVMGSIAGLGAGAEGAANRARFDAGMAITEAEATREATRARLDELISNADEAQKATLEMVRTEMDKNDSFIKDLDTRISSTMTMIDKDAGRRAGQQASGDRIATERRIAEFQAQARANGLPSDMVNAEVARMRESSTGRVQGVLAAASTEVNNLMATVGVSGFNAMSSLMSTVSGVNANLTGLATRARETSVGARQFAAGAELEAGKLVVGAREGAARTELEAGDLETRARGVEAAITQGAYDYLTGTMGFVAGNVANIIGQASTQMAQIDQNIANVRMATGQALNAADTNIATALQTAMDYAFNSTMAAVALYTGTPFQMPNVAGLAAPANALVMQGISDWRQASASPPSNHDSIWGSLIGATGYVGGAAIGKK